jgi:hypothetical protein
VSDPLPDVVVVGVCVCVVAVDVGCRGGTTATGFGARIFGSGRPPFRHIATGSTAAAARLFGTAATM